MTPTAIEDTPTTDKVLPATQPAIETPSETNVPDLSRLETACVKTLDTMPENINLEGVLVVDVQKGRDIQAYLWDWSAGEMINFGDYSVWELRISPDGNKIAVSDSELGGVVMIDSSGNQLDIIPKDWRYYLADWLDDNQLVINKENQLLDTTSAADGIVIIDLTSGERREFLPEYPNFNDIEDEVGWQDYSFSRMVVNPQRTRLIYPSTGEWGYSLIIWDIDADLEAGRVHQHIYPFNGVNSSAPIWSRDGMSFVTSVPLRYTIDTQLSFDSYRPLQYAEDETENAYINVDDEFPYLGYYELVRVSVTGEVQRLSYLTTTYRAYQDNWAWSHDETRIAFFLTIIDDNYEAKDTLAVLDVESGKVTDYCISGYATPIWSPDGRQIAINQNPRGPYTYKIVDLEEGIAFPISEEENTNIGGWIASIP